MNVHWPLIVAIAAVAGVWGVVLALRLPTIVACLAALVAASCFPVAFARLDIGPITASVDRLAIAGVLLVAVGKRILTGEPRPPLARADLVLGRLLVLLAASVWLHSWSSEWPGDMPPWYRLVSSFFAPAVLFWAARWRVWNELDARRLCLFFTLFGAYLAVTAVAEVHGISTIVFPRYILDPHNLYPGRAIGPFISAPVLGTWITIAVVSAILLIARSQGIVRALVGSLVPLLLYAEYLCKTRSAWLGFVLAVPLALFQSNLRIPRPTLIALLLAAVLVAGVCWGDELIMPSRAEGRAVVAQSTGQRLALAERSIALFLDRPIFGWGFGQFEHVAHTRAGSGPLRLAPAGADTGLASHNLLLRVIAETGLLGTVTFLTLLGHWLGHARRLTTTTPIDSAERELAVLFTAAFVAYWCEAMFHDVTHMMIGNLTIFFLAGAMPRDCRPEHASRPVPKLLEQVSVAPRWIAARS